MQGDNRCRLICLFVYDVDTKRIKFDISNPVWRFLQQEMQPDGFDFPGIVL